MAILDPDQDTQPDASHEWRAPGADEAAPPKEALSKANRWRLLLAPFYKISSAIVRFLNFTIFSSLTQRIIELLRGGQDAGLEDSVASPLINRGLN